MAQIIPSSAALLFPGDGHPGEWQTLQHLQRELSHDFLVFHAVQWTDSDARRTAYGEIDFVIVNQSGDVLVVEQKNGSLKETDQGLVKSYAFKEKNLHSQIGTSIAQLRSKFQKQNPHEGLIIEYLLYCPDHRLKNVQGPALDASRIVHAGSRESLAQRVATLLGTGVSAGPEGRLGRVRRFFEQSYQLVPDVATAITAGERAYTRLASGLREVVSNIETHPPRLRVQGVAGCGKSQLALDCLAKASPEAPTLYVCFNRPLADRMAEAAGGMRPGLRIDTFHGLCVHALEVSGQPVDFGESERNPHFWSRLPDRVIEAEVPEALRFRRLVVDEGQDFQPEWWDVLQLFLEPDHELLWFEDPLQRLHDGPAVTVPARVTYHARESFRSPPSIAAFIAEAHSVPFRSALQHPGLGVGLSVYDQPRDQVRLLRSRINDLRAKGFSNEQIIVLTCAGLDRSELYELDEIAGVTIRKFTGRFDGQRRAVYTDGRLLFDSVRRFKGGQAPCVILVDVDPQTRHLERDRSAIFCGMTRAQQRLEMLLRADNPHNAVYHSAAADAG